MKTLGDHIKTDPRLAALRVEYEAIKGAMRKAQQRGDEAGELRCACRTVELCREAADELGWRP